MRKIKQKGGEESSKSQTPSTTTNLFKIIKNAYLFIPLLIISARHNYLCGKKKKTMKREGESEEKHFNKRFVFMH